jgi:alpha-tubulin suppressor-like RCC1 family protein
MPDDMSETAPAWAELPKAIKATRSIGEMSDDVTVGHPTVDEIVHHMTVAAQTGGISELHRCYDACIDAVGELFDTTSYAVRVRFYEVLNRVEQWVCKTHCSGECAEV